MATSLGLGVTLFELFSGTILGIQVFDARCGGRAEGRRPGGFGLLLTKKLMDDVIYSEQGITFC